MKLIRLYIEPSSNKGWKSEELVFGNEMTQVYGENGSGKTPIMKFIVFALGYSCKFRDDIYQNCSYVNLFFSHNKELFHIKRKIDQDFNIEFYSEKKNDIFYLEEKFTAFLFELLNIKYPTIISNSKEPTHPYMSTLLPLFFLNQDGGYTEIYKAPSSFIKDQYSEMVRLILDIYPKNSFDKKKEIFKLNSQLDVIDKEIVKSKKIIEDMQSSGKDIKKIYGEILKDIELYSSQIDNLNNSKTVKNDLLITLEKLVLDKQKKFSLIHNNIVELETRINSFEQIKMEIDLEINTLSLNEESKRVFQSFNEICTSQNCGLFMKSAESYGKNLLYLRDQIKDLERNSLIFQKEITMLNESKIIIKEEITVLKKDLDNMTNTLESNEIIGTLNELFKKVFELERSKQSFEHYFYEKNKLNNKLSERESIQNAISSLEDGKNSLNTKLHELRKLLVERLIFWLDILKTKNVSRNISIDNDFKPTFDGEKINQFAGSTLVRIVLAIHASIFELYLKESNKNSLRFLILDTPRQQELDLVDLSDFVTELKKLCNEYNSQLIYSSTSYRYECDDNDKEWIASFEGKEQKMFLG